MPEGAQLQFAGVKDLLKFLDYLRSRGIRIFRIDQRRNDSVMVTFTLVGVRVEVDFFDNHIEFSYFTGDEGVLRDEADLARLIDDHWGD